MDYLPPPADQLKQVGFSLSQLELDAINAAYKNLSQPTVSQRGHEPNWPTSAFGVLESQSVRGLDGAKCALDPNAFQILRYHDSAAIDPHWVRFGFQRVTDGKHDGFKTFVRESMYSWTGKDTVDLASETPDVARRLNLLWPRGLRVVALLGTARLGIEQGMALIDPIQSLVDHLNDVAYMNGGYRGMTGDSYGVTRAGLDVPQAKGKETLTVMCRAGIEDANVTANAISIYGQQWGDDTPGLAAASDGAVFFRNIPAKTTYGKWTFIEIANMLHGNKPIVIFDPLATTSEEVYFGATVPVRTEAAEVAAYLMENMTAADTVRSRAPLAVQPTQMLTLGQHEQYLAIRLYIDAQNEFARWELQGAAGRQPFLDAGLKFSDSANALQGERDLVIDGYWKDIMLLQYLKKLPKNTTPKATLIKGYAECRKAIEDKKLIDTAQNTIDGIWFIYRNEHRPGALDALGALPQNDYAKSIAAAAAL